MNGNIRAIVEVNEDDIKEYLLQFYQPEQVENMDINYGITEVLNGILSNYFSDYRVYNERSMWY